MTQEGLRRLVGGAMNLAERAFEESLTGLMAMRTAKETYGGTYEPGGRTLCVPWVEPCWTSHTYMASSSPSIAREPATSITSARSTKLSAEYSHEDSGSSVAREEEGGIV